MKAAFQKRLAHALALAVLWLILGAGGVKLVRQFGADANGRVPEASHGAAAAPETLERISERGNTWKTAETVGARALEPLKIFGLFAVTAMMLFYALEDRSPWCILAFAGSCILASAYGFLEGAWPLGIVEGAWSIVAARRWSNAMRAQDRERESFRSGNA